MIRYPNIYNMMSCKPISRKVKLSWNIASEVAHTMRRSMRINLQNVKENRKKSAISTPEWRILRPIIKTPQNMESAVNFTFVLRRVLIIGWKFCRFGVEIAVFLRFSFTFWRLIRILLRIVCATSDALFQERCIFLLIGSWAIILHMLGYLIVTTCI